MNHEESTGRRSQLLLLTIFCLTVGAICWGGYRLYSAQRDLVEGEVTNRLQAIADLKAEQLVEWRKERLGDARLILADGALLRSLEQLVTHRASSSSREETLAWLSAFCTQNKYSNAILFDFQGHEVLKTGGVYGSPEHLQQIFRDIQASDTAILRDLHSEAGGAYHYGLNIPLRLRGQPKIFGMMSLAIDPRAQLFRILDLLPGPQRPGETLLVRRDGSIALYAARSFDQDAARQTYAFTPSKRGVAALRALNGRNGLIRYADRLNRPSLAVVRSIADSDWLLIIQAPLAVVGAPVRDRALPIVFAVVALVLAATLTVVLLWWLQRRHFERAQHSAELEKRALASHYNFLSRSANDAILLVDEGGNIVEANERALAVYGYSRAELLKVNVQSLRAQHGGSEEYRRWWASGGAEPTLYETSHFRKDGSSFPAEVSNLAIRVEGKEYRQVIVRDITRRKLEREQLDHARRLYAVLSGCNQALLHADTMQQTFEAVCQAAVQEGGLLLAMVVKLDPRTGDVHPVATAGEARAYADGLKLSARDDEYGRGLIGTSLRTGKSLLVNDFEHDERHLPWRERARRMGLRSVVAAPFRRGGEVEFCLVLYAGELNFFGSAEVKLMEEVAGDIEFALARLDAETLRRATEEALRTSEERYRQLVESSPVGMYIHTGGIVRYMNAIGRSMLGFHTLEEVVGKRIDSFVHPDDLDVVWERIRVLMAGGENPLIEERFVRTDGGEVHVEVSAVTVDFEGEKSSFVFFLDVTQRKQAELDRARMEEQFLQAQKMESVGRLAGGVAHDFNNDLTVINGYCDLLLESLSQSSPLRQTITEVRRAGARAAQLTRQLLTFSSRQVASRQHVDLNALVTESRSILSRLIGDHIRIATSLAPDLPAVVADPTQLHQVLMNLAINSRDAMPSGGDLTISTNSVFIADEHAVGNVGARPGNFVVLTVSDTGAGMDTETQRHIFEPFFTTKARGAGTGLGLATVYGILQQHNGWTEVQSRPCAGTTFRIILPAADGAAPKAAETSASTGNGHETILLVEDRDDVRMLTKEVLRGLGYVVLEAASGAAALEIAAQAGRRIDLLLTDVVMPGMAGPELAGRLRRELPSIKVLFISGYADTEQFGAAGAESVQPLLPKPFTPSALAAKLREVLER